MMMFLSSVDEEEVLLSFVPGLRYVAMSNFCSLAYFLCRSLMVMMVIKKHVYRADGYC